MEAPQPMVLLRTRHAWPGTFDRNVACIADLAPSLVLLVCHSDLGENTRATSAMIRCLRQLLFLEAEFGRFKKELTRSAVGDCGVGSHACRTGESFRIYPRVSATAAYDGIEMPQPLLESAEADNTSSIMQTAVGCSRVPLIAGPLVGLASLRTATTMRSFCSHRALLSVLSAAPAYRALLFLVPSVRHLPVSEEAN